MGRPPRHDADRLLDAAVTVVAEHGPRALTMTAVARTAGAPSGSMYHRFPNQSALLAGVWLRTVARFQEGFLAALAAGAPTDAAVAAARHVVDWSRRHPDQARVLLAGSREFAEADWSAQAREIARNQNAELERALLRLAESLGESGHSGLSRVVLAVVDLPHAVVRRHLTRGTDIPTHESDLVAEAVRALLDTH